MLNGWHFDPHGGFKGNVCNHVSTFWGLKGRWSGEDPASLLDNPRRSRDIPRGQPSSRSKSSPATGSNVPDRYVRVLIDLATDPQRLSAMPYTYEAYL